MSFTSTLWRGLLAGGLAGLLLGILQVAVVSPLILEAEKYEGGASEASAPAGEKTAPKPVAQADGHEHGHSHGHDHGSHAWQRPTFTVVGGTALGIALGLLSVLLLNVLPLDGFRTNWVFGLLFGVCGFLSVNGIPSMGLPPPLPGVIGGEADFPLRQRWWLLAVSLSGLGFLTIGCLPHLLRSRLQVGPGASRALGLLLGATLLALPFVLGVPEHSTASSAPAWLRNKFVATTLSVNAVFWVLLGGLSSWLLSRGARLETG